MVAILILVAAEIVASSEMNHTHDVPARVPLQLFERGLTRRQLRERFLHEPAAVAGVRLAFARRQQDLLPLDFTGLDASDRGLLQRALFRDVGMLRR